MKKTALITGASGGLGKEFAAVFAKNGYDVVLVARGESAMQKLKETLEAQYGCHAYVVPADLTEKDAPSSVFRFTEENGIFVDTLVNNAGFGDFGAFADCDIEKQNRMVQLNIQALMQMTWLYLSPMIKRGNGNILNVASIASFEAGPLMSVYYATKAFVLSFTEALYAETKGSGVHIGAICPGPTETGFEKNASLAKSGLFKNLRVAPAKDVAAYAYRRLMKKKVISVHGASNRLIVRATKFAPRCLVRKCVMNIQKEQ